MNFEEGISKQVPAIQQI